MEVVEHFGIDWPHVNGMDVLTAQTVLTQGRHVPDAFFTEKQFHQLGWYPNEQTGDKILKRRSGQSRCHHVFRNATVSVTKPKRREHNVAACVRYLALPRAIAAMACKLACLFDWLVKHEQPYVDNEHYEG